MVLVRIGNEYQTTMATIFSQMYSVNYDQLPGAPRVLVALWPSAPSFGADIRTGHDRDGAKDSEDAECPDALQVAYTWLPAGWLQDRCQVPEAMATRHYNIAT